jgi:hypothetical protein
LYAAFPGASGGILMGHGPTLILTTRLGVRPLGVRGDPLHAVAGQLLAVIRRRLGDGPANLLAEPQLRESGDGIDWYAQQSGEIRRFSDLSEAERQQTLAAVDGHLAAINGLGEQLGASQSSDEARLIGRSLQLSTRRPSDDYIFLVDGEPVIAAWGYEPDALASLQGFMPTSVPALASAAAPPAPAAVLASAPAIMPAAFGWSRWWGALLWGLLFLILLLLASWLLRACAATDPSLNIATHETEAPPAPPPPPDPTPVLKASLDDARAEEKKLKAELAALQDGIKHKVAMCKPVEPPKPPQIAKAPPPPPPPAPQQQAHAAPPPNRPPPGTLPCDWSGDSGGEGVTRNKHYLGDRPGFVAINYDLYVRPDDIKVVYRGQVLAGTHGPRSGRGGFGFNWNPVAGDYSVDVIVTGEMWGTRWKYQMSCPRN